MQFFKHGTREAVNANYSNLQKQILTNAFPWCGFEELQRLFTSTHCAKVTPLSGNTFAKCPECYAEDMNCLVRKELLLWRRTWSWLVFWSPVQGNEKVAPVFKLLLAKHRFKGIEHPKPYIIYITGGSDSHIFASCSTNFRVFFLWSLKSKNAPEVWLERFVAFCLKMNNLALLAAGWLLHYFQKQHQRATAKNWEDKQVNIKLLDPKCMSLASEH